MRAKGDMHIVMPFKWQAERQPESNLSQSNSTYNNIHKTIDGWMDQ